MRMNSFNNHLEEIMSTYVYSINSIGLDIVFFASRRSAFNYAEKHNIRMTDGSIKIHRVNSKIAQAVREDFNEYKIFKTNK